MRRRLAEGSHVLIVGGGVAGITCALELQDRYRVTLVESRSRIGGHANPTRIQSGTEPVTVDAGFLVFNRRTYPRFLGLLERLGVKNEVVPTDMSFGVSSERDGIHFCDTSINGLLDGGRNLCRARSYRLLVDLLRLRRRASRQLNRGETLPGSVAEYCRAFSPKLLSALVLPLGSAIWTLPARELEGYPAHAFFSFFDNHGLLRGDSGKQWCTLRGSSAVYLRAFQRAFRGRLVVGRRARRISRRGTRVEVSLEDGTLSGDALVLATHADESLRLLAEPTQVEEASLGSWRYHESRAIIHTDRSLMPREERQWASWNVIIGSGEPIVTYHLNRVQALPTTEPLFLSLTRRTVPSHRVHRTFVYRHPIFDSASVASQATLRQLRGTARTWFCGSYFGHGFHEDAVTSAIAAARSLGGSA